MKAYICKDDLLKNWPLCDEPADAYKFVRDCPTSDVVPREEYAKLQEENTKLKNQVWSLKKKIREMKSDASWEEDIRRGQVQGMW